MAYADTYAGALARGVLTSVAGIPGSDNDNHTTTTTTNNNNNNDTTNNDIDNDIDNDNDDDNNTNHIDNIDNDSNHTNMASVRVPQVTKSYGAFHSGVRALLVL